MQTNDNENASRRTPVSWSRRRLLQVGTGLGMTVTASALLAACGGDDDDDDDTATPLAATATIATTSGSDATATAPVAATEPAAQAEATAAATEVATEAATETAPSMAISGNSAASPAAGDAWTWTDSRGETLEFPSMPTRIVAEVTVAASLWDLGIRPVGIYGTSRGADGAPSAQAGNLDLDAVTSLGEEWGVIDIEALIALDADVLIDQDWGDGAAWGLMEEAAALVNQTIPMLLIDVDSGTLVDIIDRYEALGVALGADLDAPEAVAASDAFDAAQAELQAAIDASEGITAIFVSPTLDGIYVAHPDNSADLKYYRELGLDIIEHEVPEDFWELLSWEQANKYTVDLILIDARAGYERPEAYADITTWEQLPAVVADQVGPWYFNLPYTRATVAEIFLGMADILSTAEDVA